MEEEGEVAQGGGPRLGSRSPGLAYREKGQFVTDLEADKWCSPTPATDPLYLEHSSSPSHWTAQSYILRKMSSSVLAVIAISLEVLPALSHRLITNPYPDQEWDSIIVSSDPITVRDKTQNATAPIAPPRPQKRSFDECPECPKDNTHIVDRFLERYSALGDDQPKDSKSYWTMLDSQTHRHPFEDKKGWVTLEPVPWSTSKISKWHPNKVVIHQEENPWDYGASSQRPVQQFWVSESGFRPERPVAQWGMGTNDIITDNKPSGFPTGDVDYNRRPNRPEDSYSSNHNFHQYEQKGSHPERYQNQQHPSSYPSNGNGEWVLLSTTKGYSHPQRHRWPAQKDLKIIERAFVPRSTKAADISKYHEEDLTEKFALGGSTSSGNRKSDENSTETPPQVLYTGSSKDDEPAVTYRRKVRLQVLPSLTSSSSSHGGLLEVDSSTQTVEEAQKEEEDMQKLKAIAKVKKSKIRGYKLVPASKITGKGMSQTNVVTLAAVGAGMIPATMALLVPMALGRRKRNVGEGLRSREYNG